MTLTKDEAWLLKEKYNGEKTEGFFADCARLAAGEPLAYVIGHIPFLGHTIYLDSHPLIPRPETEFWTEYVINTFAATPPQNILDCCAGSGCIGVTLAAAWPEAAVDYIEIEPAHQPTIAKNRTALKVSAGEIFIGDLFSALPANTKRYDLIVSNPPYIDPAIDRAEPAVKTHEPAIALYGGTAGLEVIERLIKEAPEHLTPEGVLYIEHEPEQAFAIYLLGRQAGFSVTTILDQYHYARVSELVLQ